MNQNIYTWTVHLPWWTYIYLDFCRLFAISFGLEVDPEKVSSFIAKHVTTELHPVEDE